MLAQEVLHKQSHSPHLPKGSFLIAVLFFALEACLASYDPKVDTTPPNTSSFLHLKIMVQLITCSILERLWEAVPTKMPFFACEQCLIPAEWKLTRQVCQRREDQISEHLLLRSS